MNKPIFLILALFIIASCLRLHLEAVPQLSQDTEAQYGWSSRSISVHKTETTYFEGSQQQDIAETEATNAAQPEVQPETTTQTQEVADFQTQEPVTQPTTLQPQQASQTAQQRWTAFTKTSPQYQFLLEKISELSNVTGVKMFGAKQEINQLEEKLKELEYEWRAQQALRHSQGQF